MPRKGTLTILIRWNRTTIRCLVTLRRYKTTAAVAYFLTNRTVRKPLCCRGYKVLKKRVFHGEIFALFHASLSCEAKTESKIVLQTILKSRQIVEHWNLPRVWVRLSDDGRIHRLRRRGRRLGHGDRRRLSRLLRLRRDDFVDLARAQVRRQLTFGLKRWTNSCRERT